MLTRAGKMPPSAWPAIIPPDKSRTLVAIPINCHQNVTVATYYDYYGFAMPMNSSQNLKNDKLLLGFKLSIFKEQSKDKKIFQRLAKLNKYFLSVRYIPMKIK
jgi:hypothetical protein